MAEEKIDEKKPKPITEQSIITMSFKGHIFLNIFLDKLSGTLPILLVVYANSEYTLLEENVYK